jgi:hypothetical protein
MHFVHRHLRNRNLRGSDRGSLLSYVLPSSSSSSISAARSVVSTLWRSVFSCVSSRQSFRSSRSSKKLGVRRQSPRSFFRDFETRASRRSEGSESCSEEERVPLVPSETELPEKSFVVPRADQQPEPPTGSPPMSEPGLYPAVPPPEYNKDHESEFEKYQAEYDKAKAMWKERDRACGRQSWHSTPRQNAGSAGPSARALPDHDSFDLFAKNEPEGECVKEELPGYEDDLTPPKYRRGFL